MLLFKKTEGEIVNGVTGVECLAIDGQQHGLTAVCAEECVDDGANQHFLTTGAHGVKLIQECLVQIQEELCFPCRPIL